jgi:hypothetical protein
MAYGRKIANVLPHSTSKLNKSLTKTNTSKNMTIKYKWGWHLGFSWQPLLSYTGHSVMLGDINTTSASKKHVASFNTLDGGHSRFPHVNNTHNAWQAAVLITQHQHTCVQYSTYPQQRFLAHVGTEIAGASHINKHNLKMMMEIRERLLG